MSKIIVTGGYGFIGSHLVDRLIKLQHEVIVLDNISTGKRENLYEMEDKFEFIPIDLSEEGYCIRLLNMKEIDYIFHLAALPRIQFSLDKPLKTMKTNIGATVRMLEHAKRLQAKRFIFASSSSVYGDQRTLPLREYMVSAPRSPYALQKHLSEEYSNFYSEFFNVPIANMRFFNVYGSRMATEGVYKLVFANWIESIKKNKPMLIYGDGKQTRDFTYISDIVDALIASMDIPQDIKRLTLNIGSGRQTSVERLAQLFNYPYEHVDARAFEEKFKVADISIAKEILHYEPKVMIEQGVEIVKKEYGI